MHQPSGTAYPPVALFFFHKSSVLPDETGTSVRNRTIVETLVVDVLLKYSYFFIEHGV